MSDFLKKITKESTTSRYQQQLIPQEEGKEARTDGVPKGQTVPDSLIKYNSAGGDVPEKDIKPQLEAGKYGKVRVITETHAGHVILVDETSGNERIYILHPNGTYTNIEPKLKTDKCETDCLQLTNGEMKVEISGNHIEFIHKDHNVKIYQDENENIDGNKTDNVLGYEKRFIGGNKSDTIGGNYSIDVSGNWTINVGGSTDLTSGGPVTVKAPSINLN